MGGAPGTRETDLLQPEFLIEAIDAIVLSGGSPSAWMPRVASCTPWPATVAVIAVGSAAVPIVPAAILFDLLNGGDKKWGDEPPYRRLGGAAYAAARDTFALGSVGAGYRRHHRDA
jgi:L-aminopeptidase/D-esterase-like protein